MLADPVAALRVPPAEMFEVRERRSVLGTKGGGIDQPGQSLPRLRFRPPNLQPRIHSRSRTPPSRMRRLTPPITNAWAIPHALIRVSLRLNAP